MKSKSRKQTAGKFAQLLLFVSAVSCTSEGAQDEPSAGVAHNAITGNIDPYQVQIDGPQDGADYYADAGAPLNAGADKDWVFDLEANEGIDCLGNDALASCIEPGVTGATGGTGHWLGVRIVDGIGTDDSDIFLQGGKENDTSTWVVGPGSVGSSKYDLTQAYLANNQEVIYFGMERGSNNGTTAFDFEFNQRAPMSDPACPQDPQVPCRTGGDVLFTFEMQGAGSSGSATPFIYTWDENLDEYVLGSAEGIVSSINASQSTAGPPWGHVDRRGDWVLGPMDRYTFAEAAAPVALLPGVDNCGGTAHVQVRTRSSSTATSDLKDTTQVFEFIFNAVEAQATLSPSCDQGFGFAASGTDSNGQPIANPICHWTFSNSETSDSCEGFMAADPGTYTASVVVSSADHPECTKEVETGSVDVHTPIGVTAYLTATCDESVEYEAVVSGGSDASGAGFAWEFTGGGTISPSNSSARVGSFAVGTPGIPYTGTVIATDPRTDILCTAEDQDSAIPYAPLSVSLEPVASPQTCSDMSSDEVTYQAIPSGGDGSYSYTWNGIGGCAGATCTIDPVDSDYCHSQDLSVTIADGSGLCANATSEVETYGKVTVVTASNN